MLAENEFSIEEEEVDEETEEKVRETLSLFYFIFFSYCIYVKSSIVLKNLFQLIHDVSTKNFSSSSYSLKCSNRSKRHFGAQEYLNFPQLFSLRKFETSLCVKNKAKSRLVYSHKMNKKRGPGFLAVSEFWLHPPPPLLVYTGKHDST
jgi:hypothetical protein